MIKIKKYNSFIKKAKELGVEEAEIISTSTIETAHWVKWKCRYACEDYGENFTCPPYTPSVEETEKVLKEYDRAILLKGHNDPEMQKIIIELENYIFLSGYRKAFGIACGPCKECDECQENCPKPEQTRPSLESCGIDVYATVRNNGYEIEVLKDKSEIPDYYAMVLIE